MGARRRAGHNAIDYNYAPNSMRHSSYPSCPPTQYARVRQGDEGTLEDKYRGRQIPPRKTNFRRTAAIRAREPPCNTLTVDTAAAVALLVYSVAPLGGGTGATISSSW